MNALDQAFIKAFAKDRSPAATAKRRMTALRAQPQPPAEGVESVSLVLHDLYQQGKRLRIDRPTSDNVALDAHMIVPLVEHVESYDTDDVLHATQPPVVFEDRLTPLDPVGPVSQSITELDGPDVAQQRTEFDSDQQVPQPESSVTESSVDRRTDAIVDKDVPTLDLPAAELHDSAEDQLLAQCLPQVLLATTQLAAPELMTLELGQLEQVATPSLEIATSAIAIALPPVDLEALEASARNLPTKEVTRRNANPVAALESNRVVEEPPAAAQPVIEPQEYVPPAEAPTATSEAVVPETVVLEALVPEPVVPEPVVPEAVVPEAVVPEAVVPEAVVPAVESEPMHAPQPTPLAVEPIAVDPTVCSFTAELPAVEPALHVDLSGTGIEVPKATPMSAAPAEVTEPAVVVDSVAPEPAPTVPFTPAWEVDAFRWPGLCQQLDDQTAGRLTESGAELNVATQDGLKVLAVTSSHRLEGRTTLALALARTAAVAGSRVALVDADSANPELARRLGMEAPCDWREVVRRGEPMSEAAVASLDDGVTLFPRTFPTDEEIGFSDESLSSTLSELGRSFDLVVVDLPPESPSNTTLEHSATSCPATPCPVDMAVVVRNVQTTSQEQCLATVASLRKRGVRAVGVIENFTQTEDNA